ncbi:hypothetical protein BV898_08226 [Hypsibius exemplaris]|uniref:Uncharacterized protein n=1 Tax=Hypsibius exemplaris TaxID=2072580 RepID=A0A1W0WRF7_HYPEX|nr:hypothetical protein BV898_08226 [Hypsibius exemplaris]
MPGICDMEFLFPAVLYIVSFSSLIQSQQQSQSTCSYSIDQKGRKQVLCEQFRIDLGVSFNFNPNSFDLDTKVLIVTGSPSKPNQFNQTSNFNSTIFEEIHICYAPQWEIIGDDTFRLVSETLLVLNLTHNGLRSVNEGTFRNLSRLTHLHLDNNRIGFLPSSVFGYLTALRVLTLTKNLINNVEPRMGYQLGNLEVLDMSSNPIGSEILGGVEPTISQSFLTLFEDWPSLRILRLSDTGLKSLPWAVIQFRSPLLRELDFSGNQLENIGIGVTSTWTYGIIY